jgi:hypothetical protein
VALAQAPFPAVSDPQPMVKELVDFPRRNLEADLAFARENGLVASTAFDSSCPFLLHKSPLAGSANLPVTAWNLAPALTSWQWTENPPSLERRSPAKL